MAYLAVFCVCLFALASVAVSTKKDVCSLECVKRIYAENCGGAQCVAAAKTLYERETFCAKRCGHALASPAMLSCLILSDLNRPDWAEVQDRLLDARRNACAVISPTGQTEEEMVHSAKPPIGAKAYRRPKSGKKGNPGVYAVEPDLGPALKVENDTSVTTQKSGLFPAKVEINPDTGVTGPVNTSVVYIFGEDPQSQPGVVEALTGRASTDGKPMQPGLNPDRPAVRGGSQYSGDPSKKKKKGTRIRNDPGSQPPQGGAVAPQFPEGFPINANWSFLSNSKYFDPLHPLRGVSGIVIEREDPQAPTSIPPPSSESSPQEGSSHEVPLVRQQDNAPENPCNPRTFHRLSS